MLLWSATPDSLARLKSSQDQENWSFVMDTYFKEQQHESLSDYLLYLFHCREDFKFVQVCSFFRQNLYMMIELKNMSIYCITLS